MKPAILVAIAAFVSFVPFVAVARAQERYVSAEQDDARRLRIQTADGRTIAVPPEPEQVGVSDIEISPDGRVVGWTPVFGNCCTSYPIPHALHVYADGRTLTFAGNGLPVFRWAFVGGGAEVVFGQETVHGGIGINYEWRHIATGRLVAQYTPNYGPENHPLPEQNPPAWVVALDRKR